MSNISDEVRRLEDEIDTLRRANERLRKVSPIAAARLEMYEQDRERSAKFRAELLHELRELNTSLRTHGWVIK